MAKISQASAKYNIHAKIDIDGVVDRPDVVGAIFGQIEGLLGADLELRELQRSGRIGRIEVNVNSKGGKTNGTILIPSSLDKAETAIVGGALEIIERIGPCEAKIQVTRIEDERASKRQAVISRAKQLLKHLNDSELPESKELSNEVSEGVRVADVQTYGRDKLACGPDVSTSKDVIFVEGRADVMNLLRHGIKNAISVNGTSAPQTAKELSKKKNVTLFVDGDRGGDLIIKELTSVCEIDYVAKAPDGKEVEELQFKEIHQALRGRRKTADYNSKGRSRRSSKKTESKPKKSEKTDKKESKSRSKKKEEPKTPSANLSDEDKKRFAELRKELKKNEAYILDKDNQILGKVNAEELADTLPNLSDINAVVVKGALDAKASAAVDKARLKAVVADKAEKLRTPLATSKDLK